MIPVPSIFYQDMFTQAEIDLGSYEPFFCCLQFCKSTNSFKLRSVGMYCIRTKEIVLETFARLGYEVGKFGLHSLRSGEATAAANAGRHGSSPLSFSETPSKHTEMDNLNELSLKNKSTRVRILKA